jgi:hypothetical protein
MILFPAAYKTFFPVHIIFICITFPQTIHARTPADSRYFGGGGISFHERSGYIDFGEGRTEHIAANPLRTFGLVYGKNFRLPAGLRLQVPLQFEYGTVNERTIEDLEVIVEQKYNVITDVDLYSVFYLAGCRPTVQAPVRLTENTWANCNVGVGVHYVLFTEECRKDNVPYEGKKQDVRMGTEDFDYLESDRHVCFSASAGAGLEILLGQKHLISLQYAFLFWEPVNRKTSRDLFVLYPKSMYERFLTHSFSIVYFISRTT